MRTKTAAAVARERARLKDRYGDLLSVNKSELKKKIKASPAIQKCHVCKENLKKKIICHACDKQTCENCYVPEHYICRACEKEDAQYEQQAFARPSDRQPTCSEEQHVTERNVREELTPIVRSILEEQLGIGRGSTTLGAVHPPGNPYAGSCRSAACLSEGSARGAYGRTSGSARGANANAIRGSASSAYGRTSGSLSPPGDNEKFRTTVSGGPFCFYPIACCSYPPQPGNPIYGVPLIFWNVPENYYPTPQTEGVSTPSLYSERGFDQNSYANEDRVSGMCSNVEQPMRVDQTGGQTGGPSAFAAPNPKCTSSGQRQTLGTNSTGVIPRESALSSRDTVSLEVNVDVDTCLRDQNLQNMRYSAQQHEDSPSGHTGRPIGSARSAYARTGSSGDFVPAPNPDSAIPFTSRNSSSASTVNATLSCAASSAVQPPGGTRGSVHDPSGTATNAVHTSLGTQRSVYTPCGGTSSFDFPQKVMMQILRLLVKPAFPKVYETPTTTEDRKLLGVPGMSFKMIRFVETLINCCLDKKYNFSHKRSKVLEQCFPHLYGLEEILNTLYGKKKHKVFHLSYKSDPVTGYLLIVPKSKSEVMKYREEYEKQRKTICKSLGISHSTIDDFIELWEEYVDLDSVPTEFNIKNRTIMEWIEKRLLI
jgi:hypothetical protein